MILECFRGKEFNSSEVLPGCVCRCSCTGNSESLAEYFAWTHAYCYVWES
jgi:hypothetical protein